MVRVEINQFSNKNLVNIFATQRVYFVSISTHSCYFRDSFPLSLWSIFKKNLFPTHVKRNWRAHFGSDRWRISIRVCLAYFLHFHVFSFIFGNFFFGSNCSFRLCRLRASVLRGASSSSLSRWRTPRRTTRWRPIFFLFFLRPWSRFLLLEHLQLQVKNNEEGLASKKEQLKCKLARVVYELRALGHVTQLNSYLFLSCLQFFLPFWIVTFHGEEIEFLSRPRGDFTEISFTHVPIHFDEHNRHFQVCCRLFVILITWVPVTFG